MHCSLLAEDAIKSAIKDYQSKREKRLALAVSLDYQVSLGVHADSTGPGFRIQCRQRHRCGMNGVYDVGLSSLRSSSISRDDQGGEGVICYDKTAGEEKQIIQRGETNQPAGRSRAAGEEQWSSQQCIST